MWENLRKRVAGTILFSAGINHVHYARYFLDHRPSCCLPRNARSPPAMEKTGARSSRSGSLCASRNRGSFKDQPTHRN